MDLGIVASSRGSGVTIASREKAVAYVRQYRDFLSIDDLHRRLVEGIQRQQEESRQINKLLGKLVEKTERFRTSNPFVPYRVQVPPDSPHVGKTLQDLNFWHNTQATVVAIAQDGSLRLSPGPYVTLKAGDVLYYLGSADCVNRVERLFSTGV